MKLLGRARVLNNCPETLALPSLDRYNPRFIERSGGDQISRHT